VRERTFDVDYLNNTTGAPTPDGVRDASGQNTIFIAASAPLVLRDAWRQTGSDLITLVKSLAAGRLDLDGDSVGDVDPTRIHYAGISLGGIVGPACVCSQVQSFYVNVAGGPLPQILNTSPNTNVGVYFRGLLAGANPLLTPGATLYAQFIREMQAIVDSGDPVNYVRQLAIDRPVLFTKVVGDKVVPNGTNDYLILASGATRAATAGLQAVAAGAPRYVTFLSTQPAGAPDVAGAGPTHSSLLSPFGSLAATTEMQTHAASLAASGGAAFQVANAALLEQ
jgi:hypothetical protein